MEGKQKGNDIKVDIESATDAAGISQESDPAAGIEIDSSINAETKPVKIDIIEPAGFCRGVENAISTVLDYRKANPDEPITLFGPLVHNHHVVEDLKSKGVQTLDLSKDKKEDLKKITTGTVIFSAHGISQDLVLQAKAQGLKVIETTCPFVLFTQSLIKDNQRKGNIVFYIGKKGHPECEAALSLYKDEQPIYLIEKEEDIPEPETLPKLDKNKDSNSTVFVINQTTLNVLSLQNLHNKILEKYPDAILAQEICASTRTRQQSVLSLSPQEYDVVLIIGDNISSNTTKLKEVALSKGFGQVEQIESIEELDHINLRGSRIALLSGASTPKEVVKEIAAALKNKEPAAR